MALVRAWSLASTVPCNAKRSSLEAWPSPSCSPATFITCVSSSLARTVTLASNLSPYSDRLKMRSSISRRSLPFRLKNSANLPWGNTTARVKSCTVRPSICSTRWSTRFGLSAITSTPWDVISHSLARRHSVDSSLVTYLRSTRYTRALFSPPRLNSKDTPASVMLRLTMPLTLSGARSTLP